MKRAKRIDKSVMPLALILATIAAASVFGYLRLRTDAFTNKLKEKSPIAMLFVFSEAGRVHFLDLFLYHPVTKKAGLFYIPASTGSRIESVDRFDRIEVLYDEDSMQPLKQKVEQLSDLSIPFYIDISFEDVGRIVDLLGGLELFISNPVDVEEAGRRILLPSGSVLLDGEKIKDYIIYEEPLEEEGELVRRKQKFVSALLRKLSTPAVNAFVLHRRVFPYLSSFVRTNLNSRALQSFVRELAKLQADRLLTQGQRVLGTEKSVEGVEGWVLFPHHDGDLMKQTIAQNLASISSEDQSYDDTTLITMEILNGTNQDGLAKRTAVLFESFGFDVITYRNADNDQYANSVVIDRKGILQRAERAAEVIQCDRVYTNIEEDVDVDVTLILGKDFDGRYCK